MGLYIVDIRGELEGDYEIIRKYEEPTTKNNLGVDCVSRQFMYDIGATCIATRDGNGKLIALGAIEELPSVTQEPQTFKWCTDCREYDQEKHCCHRWSKVIRNTVEEIKQEQEPKTGHWKKIQSGDKDFPESIVCSRCGHENSYLDFGISSVPIGKSFKKSKFCPNCGAKMVEPQESGDKDD